MNFYERCCDLVAYHVGLDDEEMVSDYKFWLAVAIIYFSLRIALASSAP